MQILADGQRLNSSAETPNDHTWTQCGSATQSLSAAVDTTRYANGVPLNLALEASNAACTVAASPCTTAYMTTTQGGSVNVDNQAPALTLSGPTDAPSTAGAQYVSAAASAGPSGLAGISCAVDGSGYRFQSGPARRIPVAGIGEHVVSCVAQNNAIDANGTTAQSPYETWTMSIREPSVSTISFDRVVGSLRCVRARKLVRVPAQWAIVHVHGNPVRVRVPAQTRTIRVVHCRPRVVTRRVREAGRWRTERVVVLPRTVRVTTKQVAFGRSTVVKGWIGTFQGDALGHQPVEIYTAPDDGTDAYTLAAKATTSGNGSWSATLPAGPSRLVEAVYPGSGTVEPSSSQAARLVVPAPVSVRVQPSTAHWGGTISISGRVQGGHIPAAGELVLLWIGWNGGSAEIGHLYTDVAGRFQSRYTFLRGNGTETYRIWAATARESDYPFASASSRSVSVTVGP